MPWAAVGAIGGALIGAIGSNSAADTAASGQKAAAQVQQNALDYTKASSAPQRQAGAGALGILSGLYGIPYDYGTSMPSSGGYGAPGSQTYGGYSGVPSMYGAGGVPSYAYLGGQNQGGIAGTVASAHGALANPGPTGGAAAGLGGARMPLAGAGGAPAAAAGSPDYSAFYNSPGYKFTQQQGQQAIDRSAAAGGNLYSTNTMAQLGQFAEGTASQQYNNYVQQLFGIAGLGNGAASASSSTGADVSKNIGTNLVGAGNANASGVAGAYGAVGNTLTSAMNGQYGSFGGGGGNNVGATADQSVTDYLNSNPFATG